MHDAAFLDVRARADADRLVVPPQDAAEPDAGLVLQDYLADQHSGRRDPEAALARRLDAHAVKFVERHVSSDLLEVDVEDRHLELVGRLALVLLAEENRDELPVHEHFGAVILLGAGAHLQRGRAEGLAQIGLQASDFLGVHEYLLGGGVRAAAV